jgi:hypothetical protein
MQSKGTLRLFRERPIWITINSLLKQDRTLYLLKGFSSLGNWIKIGGEGI